MEDFEDKHEAVRNFEYLYEVCEISVTVPIDTGTMLKIVIIK